MRVNFKKNFRSFDGTPLEGLISDVVAKSLFNASHLSDRAMSGDEKYLAYSLCQRITSSDCVEISVEEASFIKIVCAGTLSSGAYGQVVEIMEGNRS